MGLLVCTCVLVQLKKFLTSSNRVVLNREHIESILPDDNVIVLCPLQRHQ
jgi:hypothetical protein